MAGDSVQEIKNRLSIVDVISPYVKLKKAGRSMQGLCPFHKEKTPSFHVSPERGTWHCFGCGEGGDMFSFIEKAEGVDFKSALKLLAGKAGVELVYDPAAKEHAGKLDRLREAMARAAQWYAARLAGSPALAYARTRGLSEKTIEEWGLGYAPDEWRALLEALSAQGFSVEELLSARLIKEADGKPGTYYDRFRNRLMFPIRDSAGRVVAFTGRALSSDEPAKYLNSPETELYHKSEILFGLDRAKDAIRSRGFAVLMEGQMDALHAHQAGWGNTVAVSGTALTARHLSFLKRYAENLMLALDADSAGLAASVKAARMALAEGLRVKALRLPEGKDPADVLTEDAKDFTERVKAAKPVVEFFLVALGERERDPHRLIALAERVVLPVIAAIPSPMEREHFVQVAARSLGLSSEAVRESMGRTPREPAPEKQARAASPLPAAPSHRELLIALPQSYPGTPLAERVESEYSRITGASLPAEALSESVLFKAEELYGEEPSAGAADELLHAFERAVIREAYQQAVQELRWAEAAGDRSAIDAAASRCAELSARLARFA